MSWFYNSLDTDRKRRHLQSRGFDLDKDREALRVVDDGGEHMRRFLQWKKDHGVDFEDHVEEYVRFDWFRGHVDRIKTRNDHLEKTGATYRVGLNILSALSEEERGSLTGKFQPIPDHERRRLERGNRFRPEAEEPMVYRGRDLKNERDLAENGIGPLGQDRLPQSVDWRKYGAVTDIKSQGRCGACWSFAATGALEGLTYIQTGKLISLSEDQLIECDTDPFQAACQGGNFYYSFKYMDRSPMTTEALYPYSYTQSTTGSPNACEKIHKPSVIQADGVQFIDPNEDALKRAVAQRPVAAAIHAYIDDFKDYTEGVLETPDCTDAVDHAVTIVGYGTTLDGVDFWLVKNQWSHLWGDYGYIKIRRYGGGGNGMCGIARQANILSTSSCVGAGGCDQYVSPEFCTQKDGCMESNAPISDEDWLIANSSFVFVENPDGRSDAVNYALQVTAVILSFLIVGILAFLARSRIEVLQENGDEINAQNFFFGRGSKYLEEGLKRVKRSMTMSSSNSKRMSTLVTTAGHDVDHDDDNDSVVYIPDKEEQKQKELEEKMAVAKLRDEQKRLEQERKRMEKERKVKEKREAEQQKRLEKERQRLEKEYIANSEGTLEERTQRVDEMTTEELDAALKVHATQTQASNDMSSNSSSSATTSKFVEGKQKMEQTLNKAGKWLSSNLKLNVKRDDDPYKDYI